ncbi:MAG: protein kinase domain-containing protein [Planctomycetales bacterium]|jgi:serine/threonine protein kinase
MLDGNHSSLPSTVEKGTGMTTSPGQPDNQSATPSNDAESTQAGDIPMLPPSDVASEQIPAADAPSFDPAATQDEIPTGDTDNVDETIISQTAQSLGEAVSKSGVPSVSQKKTTSGSVDFPEEFGRYAIKKELGKGAMGAVYLARDTQLNRDVALKVPTFTDKSPANMIERFYREARSAATLTHPNICPVYDVGEHDGTHFISMGFIAGRPLSAYIESGKKQPERQAAAVVKKLALALQEAHDKGIIHRDLKPANIMIDQRSEPVVMDFGLARLTNDKEEARLTREGTVMGSPAYMSPEQVEGKNLGPHCDVYSLGVVFYELLTGQTPYQGTVVSVIGQILAANPKTPIELRPDISPECSAVCLKAMASKKADRFQSMAEYAKALDAFIKGDSQAIETFVELEPRESGPTLDELKEQKAAVTSFIKKKQYKNAVSALETMSELKGKDADDLAAWAKKQLPKAQEHYEKSAEESKALFRRAKKSMAANDYERASQQLSQIPADLRNNTVSDLKAEADDLVKEVRRLSDNVAHAVQSGVHDDMLPTVERLLELKPQHRQANDLYERLYSNDRVARPARSKTPRGKSKARATVDPKLIGGAATAVVLLICLVMFWPSGDATLDEQTVSDTGMPQVGTGGTSFVTDSAAEAPTPTGPKRVAGADENSGDDRQLIRDFLKGDRRGTPEDFFRQFDKNDDRLLGQTEISLKMIGRFDQNDDRELDLEEVRSIFDQVVGRPRGPGSDDQGTRPPRPEDGEPLDNPPSNDGPPGDNRPGRGFGRPEDIFARHDANDDGVLTGREIPPFFSEKVDRNSDGEVTFDEIRQTMKELGADAFLRLPGGESGRTRPRDSGPRFPRPRD